MGYSTTLYAVDIGELKAAFGSRDAALLERVREAVSKWDGTPHVDPTKGPRVECNWKSELFLNGRQMGIDEFKEAMADLKWKGTNIYSYVSGPPRGQKREGPFKEPGQFTIFFLSEVYQYAAKKLGLAEGDRLFEGTEICSSPQQFAGAGSSDDDITEDRALDEIIAGKITQKENGHTYGYALEYLALTLGTRLGAVGKDDLKWLKVKTPLSRTKLPVKIPKPEDFPYISYMEAAEVVSEVERLRAMDLSDAQDPERERERKLFLECLERAAGMNRGVVGFYY